VIWGGTDFKWGGRAPLASPLTTALHEKHLLLKRQFKDVNERHLPGNYSHFR